MKTNHLPNQPRSSDSENGIGSRNDNLENRGVMNWNEVQPTQYQKDRWRYCWQLIKQEDYIFELPDYFPRKAA